MKNVALPQKAIVLDKLSKKGLADFLNRKSNSHLVLSELKTMKKSELVEFSKTLKYKVPVTYTK